MWFFSNFNNNYIRAENSTIVMHVEDKEYQALFSRVLKNIKIIKEETKFDKMNNITVDSNKIIYYITEPGATFYREVISKVQSLIGLPLFPSNSLIGSRFHLMSYIQVNSEDKRMLNSFIEQFGNFFSKVENVMYPKVRYGVNKYIENIEKNIPQCNKEIILTPAFATELKKIFTDFDRNALSRNLDEDKLIQYLEAIDILYKAYREDTSIDNILNIAVRLNLPQLEELTSVFDSLKQFVSNAMEGLDEYEIEFSLHYEPSGWAAIVIRTKPEVIKILETLEINESEKKEIQDKCWICPEPLCESTQEAKHSDEEEDQVQVQAQVPVQGNKRARYT